MGAGSGARPHACAIPSLWLCQVGLLPKTRTLCFLQEALPPATALPAARTLPPNLPWYRSPSLPSSSHLTMIPKATSLPDSICRQCLHLLRRCSSGEEGPGLCREWVVF